MDLRKLKTLIDLVAESDIAELEVTEGESKVRIVKSSGIPQNQVVIEALGRLNSGSTATIESTGSRPATTP